MEDQIYRAVMASKLRYQTAFSFTPNGPTFLAHHRYVFPGKSYASGYAMTLGFFTNGKGFKKIRYHLKNAQNRILYLRDLVSPNTCAKQYELDVIKVKIVNGKPKIL